MCILMFDLNFFLKNEWLKFAFIFDSSNRGLTGHFKNSSRAFNMWIYCKRNKMTPYFKEKCVQLGFQNKVLTHAQHGRPYSSTTNSIWVLSKKISVTWKSNANFSTADGWYCDDNRWRVWNRNSLVDDKNKDLNRSSSTIVWHILWF